MIFDTVAALAQRQQRRDRDSQHVLARRGGEGDPHRGLVEVNLRVAQLDGDLYPRGGVAVLLGLR